MFGISCVILGEVSVTVFSSTVDRWCGFFLSNQIATVQSSGVQTGTPAPGAYYLLHRFFCMTFKTRYMRQQQCLLGNFVSVPLVVCFGS